MNIDTDAIKFALDQLVADGRERGVQLAAYHHGKLVVNLCAGTLYPDGPSVTTETLFPVFSVSKGITATMVHRLVDRGILSYDRPIAKLWPEFGAKNKGGITLRHALDHTSGLPNMPENLRTGDMADWAKMCVAIAALTPVSAPGERAVYHAMTFGWIIGEAAARATGRDFPTLLDEEIRQPLGNPSIYISLPEEVTTQMATLEEANASAVGTPDVPSAARPLHALMNRPDMRRACIPASNGIMTAEGIARHYAGLTPGGIGGVELLAPERVNDILASFKREGAAQWSSGYDWGPGEKEGSTLGHGGYGGAAGFADPAIGLAVGYTRNRFDTPPASALIDRLRQIFESQ